MTPEEAAAAGPLPVLQLVDTAGCGFEEAQEAEGSSYANPGEAKVGAGARSRGAVCPFVVLVKAHLIFHVPVLSVAMQGYTHHSYIPQCCPLGPYA